MKTIDRLNKFLEARQISAYAFERTCGLANGYIGKQLRVRGSIGSDILEKIGEEYPELSLVWLITGQGKMEIKPLKNKRINEVADQQVEEEEAVYKIRDKLLEFFEKFEELSSTIPRGNRRRRRKKAN